MRTDYTQADLDSKLEELKKIRCKCGARMSIKITNSGLAVDLTCTKCKTAYHITLTDRDKLPAPGSGHQFTPATNYIQGIDYRCKVCSASIQEDQALRTFNEMGKSLCTSCEKD